MSKLLISNARLINEGEIRDVDVLLDGERIEKIAGQIEAADGVAVIDADGKYLMPGMVDDQVHFREPGLTTKGDLATESAAAAAGGITSFMDMPNVNPLTTTKETLADKYQSAIGRCTANYGFYFGATNTNIEEIRRLQVGQACGIKAFMGASTGDMLVDDPEALDFFQDVLGITTFGMADSKYFLFATLLKPLSLLRLRMEPSPYLLVLLPTEWVIE